MSRDDEFCPYVGLQPFREEDRDYFFGRSGDERVIVSNLYASNLTVLYGASGVGKSSVLLAGVVPTLRATPNAAVAVFRDWAHPRFHDELKRACIEAIASGRPDAPALDHALPLDELMSRGAIALKGRVFVILDQFEEYFLYHPESETAYAFDTELARAVNREDADVGILIALREDGVAKLDRFRTRIPNLLRSALRLRHLDEESAKEAICSPVEEVYNARFPRLATTIEEGLVTTLIDAVRGRQAGTVGGSGQAAGSSDQTRIETPLLQLLLTKLWKAEPRPEHGPRVLRRQTFLDMGGAEKVVERHLAEVMEALEPAQLEVCARIFDRLVTPSGTKVACREKDLAEWAEDLAPRVPDVLRRLCTGDSRILRPVAAAPGDDSGIQYEIFHDVLAGAILRWQAGHLAQKERAALEREAEEQRNRAEERARAASRLTRALWFAGVFAAVAVLSAVWAWISQRQAVTQAELASSRALATAAINQSRIDPELGVLLALHAVQAAKPLGEDALHEAVDALGRSIETARVRSSKKLDGMINDAALSADEKKLLVSVGDGALRLFMWREGWNEVSLERQDATFYSPRLAPTGKLVAAVASDRTVRIWDAMTGKLKWTLQPPGIPSVLRFSGDGAMIAAGGGYTAWVWHLGAPEPPLALAGHRDVRGTLHTVTALAFHPRARVLATAAYDNTIRLWDLHSGKQLAVLQGHAREMDDLDFSPDGRELLSASHDTTARIWNLDTRQCRVILYGHPNTVFSASYSHDGKKVVTAGADATVRIWDAESGREIALLSAHTEPVSWARFIDEDQRIVSTSWDGTVKTWSAGGHNGRVQSAFFSPDGRIIATASDDRTIRLWDPASGDELRVLNQHRAPITRIRFSGDGKRLASGDADGRIEIWDPLSGRNVASLCCHRYGIQDLAWSPDGSRLVSAARVDGVALWNVEQHVRTATLLFQPSFDAIKVAVSPDGNWIAAGLSDGTIRVWSAANPTPGREWRAHMGDMGFLGFSPDSKMVLTAGSDHLVRLWDVASGKKRHELRGHEGLVMDAVFMPDSARLVTADLKGTIIVWDTRTGGKLAGPPAHAAMAGLDLSKDGARLASFSWDRTAKVWDTKSWRELATFTHRDQVDSGAISPDGTRLATATPYGGVRVMPLDLAELIALARTRVTRDLKPDECLRYLGRKDCAPLPR